jgi:hypothetical protein
VFDAAKALDRVTITVYQSAAGEGILAWLTGAVDRLITSLGNAVYFPYLAPVVILGAIWLAWQGLIRKRATRTIEGTIWMVVACAAAIWLIGRPADFTGLGKTVSDGISQTLNVAFAGLPAPAQSSCVPVAGHDPQVSQASFSYTAGSTIVDQNANELWTVLVCKPWLAGEFGTTVYSTGTGAKPTAVNQYARQLLWSQAIATNEKATPTLITAKEDAYAGIAASIKQNYPASYALFQGNQYPTRLEIAFAALFAALVAGILVLLIAITLIILKLGFLLLLVAGPFFLIVGTHPGFGRVVALRWVEMLVGVLLKQAAIALVLSVLLYAYSLIMGTTDAALPWALKILMIALVTVAVFIYRKPFVHLFSAVGYGMVGARDRAEDGLAQAGSSARRNTLDAATVGVPGFAAYRAARWARRNPAQAAGLAAQVAVAGGAGAAAAGASAASAATGRPALCRPTRAGRRGPGWPPGAVAVMPPGPRAARGLRRPWTCRPATAAVSVRRPAGLVRAQATPRRAGPGRARGRASGPPHRRAPHPRPRLRAVPRPGRPVANPRPRRRAVRPRRHPVARLPVVDLRVVDLPVARLLAQGQPGRRRPGGRGRARRRGIRGAVPAVPGRASRRARRHPVSVPGHPGLGRRPAAAPRPAVPAPSPGAARPGVPRRHCALGPAAPVVASRVVASRVVASPVRAASRPHRRLDGTRQVPIRRLTATSRPGRSGCARCAGRSNRPLWS